jgi:(p)ppGpp synthase/HD superfamily hydrolase
MRYSERLTAAFNFAFAIHRDQVRKGSGIPYMIHVMGVAAIVGEYGGDEDQVIAALLHDAVEDGEGLKTLGEIRAQFGDRVAGIVEHCSDSFTLPKPPWLERKKSYIATIPSCPEDARLVCAADKLHNVRALTRDLEGKGLSVWERFNGRREGSLWYYTEITRALGTNWRHSIITELAVAVDAMLAADSRVQREPRAMS